MTNNPTIDGVSRWLIEQSATFLEAHSSGPSIESNLAADLRALLDAPAVERQDPKPYPDRLCHIDYTAHPYRCGCLRGDDEAQRIFDEHKVAALQSTIAQMRQLLANRVEASRLDESTDTIAQLQARVRELESGRGDPVAWLAEAAGPDGTVYRRTSSTTQITLRDVKFGWGEGVASKYEIKIQPLFTAPPSPVAASLPNGWQDTLLEEMERRFALRKMIDDGHLVNDDTQVGVEFAIEWIEACLDATAALNRKVKT